MVKLVTWTFAILQFTNVPSNERLHNQMCLHRFDIILLSIMSGLNNMRYKYYMICFCMHAAESVMLWWQVVQLFTRSSLSLVESRVSSVSQDWQK